MFIDGFLGDADRRDPRASPIHGSFEGLPPYLIQASRSELLYDDALRLAEALEKASNPPVHELAEEGTPHVWHHMVPDVPESAAALERAAAMNAAYHVLGGTLSPLDGVGPDDLNISGLVDRVSAGGVREILIAVNATVEGQTTAHYIIDQLAGFDAKITRLAHGVPVGGELDYLDEGTLAQALRARRPVG